MASKSVDFGLSCLGLPSNPVLRRVWNVPLQPRPGQAKERDWGAFQLVLWPGASGWPFLNASVSWGELLLRAHWARRWLEVSLPAKAGRAGVGARRQRRTPKGQGQAAGLHWEERSWAWGNRISSPPGRSRSGPGRTRPPLWRARLLGRPKSANNSAMLPPARPGSSGYTAAAEGQETGWRFFIVTNIKSGLSPLSLAPYPNADRKQINL